MKRLLFAALLLASPALAYDPPIGIPAPSFGIDETVADGTYTHWVDSTHGSCSDATDGTPAAPRCTLPFVITLTAGDVVQVRGGPYDFTASQPKTWTAPCTVGSPCYIRGPALPAAKPVLTFGNTRYVTLVASYLIVENLEMVSGNIDIGATSDHVSIRHFYLHDNPSGPGSMVGNSGDDFVLYDSEIAYNGVIPSAPDDHGFQTYANTTNIWVLENSFHHNSGDAIQFCHGCVGAGTGPTDVYIGGNIMHDDEENCIDIKEFRGRVVISENECYGYVASAGSAGEAVRINDEGAQGEVWFINNYIHDSVACIAPYNANADVYILGNFFDTCDRGIMFAPNSGVFVVHGNTISNITNIAMDADDAVAVDFQGNIIQDAGISIDGTNVSSCNNNLFYETTGSPVVDATCTSTQNDVDPLLNTSTGRISAGSPAIANGVTHAAYGTYLSSYSLNIQTDRDGTTRPQDGTWEIGADELPTVVPPTVIGKFCVGAVCWPLN